MMQRLLLGMMACVVAMASWAQLTIGGTPLVYDSRTRTYMLTVPQEAFGAPYHASIVPDANVTNVVINGVTVTQEVEFPLVDGTTQYTLSFKRNNTVVRSSIHFTYLPIMCLTGTLGNEYVQVPVQIIFPGQQVMNYKARVKQAGSSTNTQWVHKHNYHVKFVDDDGEKMDVSFFGLRTDNHWRLDAGTRDMIRFRNFAANGLWADFGTRSYYADKQPGARSYIRGSHVEVFLNGKYNGFYNFSEFLDRKQLKLKKYVQHDDIDDNDSSLTSVELRGMMWKANDETAQTLFAQANDTCDNTLDEWYSFSLAYPDIDEVCPTDYSVIQNAVAFVADSDDDTFLSEAARYFDLPVLIDYYLFINVVFAIDNVCNNMVYACYDMSQDKKLTFAVWDLDATVGQNYTDIEGYYRADAIQPERELDSVPATMCQLSVNRLFGRVRALPGFMSAVKKRYWELRQGILRPDSLVERYSAIYRRLDACGALARETVRWSGTGDTDHRMLDFPDEMDYLCDWIRRRIAHLDSHTFAPAMGDVNGDDVIDVADVSQLIMHILGNASLPCPSAADLNGDAAIDVADVATLIGRILGD